MAESRCLSGESCRPSFLFIGTGRAGSNWVFEVLREHPGVVLPRNKGTFFFNRNFYRGIDWYEAFFRHGGSGGVAGEVCEDYFANVQTIARISGYRRDMRLICCFRNPYERAISHWRFFARNGEAKPTLIEQGESRPDLYYLGFYATQLRALWSHFPKSQTLVYLFDDLVSDPEVIARSIYEFIGVEESFVARSTRALVNAGAEPRVKLVARVVHDLHMHSWGRSRVVSELIGRIKGVRPIRRAMRTILYKRPSGAVDWRRSLREFPNDILCRYDDEISELQSLLGRDLSHWRAPEEMIRLARRAQASEADSVYS